MMSAAPVLNEPNSIVVDYSWVSSDQVELSWRPSPNATAYRIEESPSSDFSNATLFAELTTAAGALPSLAANGRSALLPRDSVESGGAGASSEPICPRRSSSTRRLWRRFSGADDGAICCAGRHASGDQL